MNKKIQLLSLTAVRWIFVILCISIMISCKAKKTHFRLKYNYTLQKTINLPIQLHESSGLIVFDSLFWTFNDGGNESKLYGIGTKSGEIEKVITIKDVEQTDWEDISQDSKYIYIGDFGNNYGNRNNLTIVKISKANLNKVPEQEVISETISFTYPDQSDFNTNLRNTSFDCEALTCIDDSLILFTKDWIHNKSSIYELPKIAGRYVAAKIGTINTEGLITAADYNPSSHHLILAGHNGSMPFMIIFNHARTNNLVKKKFAKIVFSEFPGVRIEGATETNGHIFLSSEGELHRQAIYEAIKK
jgi:hypothetical protein